MAASALQRWWLRRRHGDGEWAALLDAPPADEWVSLDLETTGLDPRVDHILSIAAVPIRGGKVRVSERFTAQVRAERGFGIESIRHHRITPGEAAAGESVTVAVQRLLRWLGSRRLLGYNIAFDIAMLAPHARRITGFALPNPRIELVGAYEARQRRRNPQATLDLHLDAICEQLDVPMLGRHTALGDALTTAACWLVLQRADSRQRD